VPPSSPLWRRRLLAGAIDFYHLCYVALLPLLFAGGLALLLEQRSLRDELERAREAPKGVWRSDPLREAELERERERVLRGLLDDLGREARRFLNELAPRLEDDQRFKTSLDKLIQDPYTEKVHDTFERGLAALKRHLRSPAGAESITRFERFLKSEALQRLSDLVRSELDYRVEQAAAYLGAHALGERLRAALRPQAPDAKAPRPIPEALHWIHLFDRLLGEEPVLLAATRSHLAILEAGGLLAGLAALLFLVLRDLLGRRRSFGKQIAGLTVVDVATGRPASARQLAGRALVLVALLPLEVLLALIGRRLGDRLTGTRVESEG
jgi:hypothetical protein